MLDLTDRQRTCLEFIRSNVEGRGYPPTIREIGEHMGIASTNGVNDCLQALERKGFIRRDDMLARGIRITEPTVNLQETTMSDDIIQQFNAAKEALRAKRAELVKQVSQIDAILGGSPAPVGRPARVRTPGPTNRAQILEFVSNRPGLTAREIAEESKIANAAATLSSLKKLGAVHANDSSDGYRYYPVASASA